MLDEMIRRAMSRREMLITTGAAALALASCSSGARTQSGPNLSGNRAGAMGSYGVGTQFKATQPLTFSILMLSNASYPTDDKWLFWSELTKRTNVTLQPTVIPGSDYNNKRNLLVSAGQAPLIIPKTYHPDEQQFVTSGAILPVSDYLDLMPNFKDKISKWNFQPDLDTIRQQDGKFYLLPGVHQDVWLDYSLAVRTDIMDKLNLKVPSTWDDVHTMLQAMKAAYPSQYPFSDRWGIPTPGGNLLNILGAAYGAPGGWGYNNISNATWDYKNKKFALTGAMPEYKAMLQYLHTLVAEKLLDPESFTQTDDQAVAKFTSGKSFVIGTNAQTLLNPYRKQLAPQIPGATIVKIPVPIGPMGAVKAFPTRIENGVMISSKARDSENFVAMMQFVDWLWYSDAGQMFSKWGVEGTTYNGSIDAGTFQLASDVTFAGLNPSGTKQLQQTYGFFNGVFAYGGSTKFLNSQFPPEEQAFQKVMDGRKLLPVSPPAPLTADEQEQANLWGTPLKDYVTQQTLKFILGDRDLSQWDAFVGELKGKNGQQLVDLTNKAYQRFQRQHG
jgi:putative aldouronate transport system substrate-binding protein